MLNSFSGLELTDVCSGVHTKDFPDPTYPTPQTNHTGALMLSVVSEVEFDTCRYALRAG